MIQTDLLDRQGVVPSGAQMGDGPMDLAQVHYHVDVTLPCGARELLQMKIWEDKCPREAATAFIFAITKGEPRRIHSVKELGRVMPQ